MNYQQTEIQPQTIVITAEQPQYTYSAFLFIIIPVILGCLLICDKFESLSEMFYFIRHFHKLNKPHDDLD